MNNKNISKELLDICKNLKIGDRITITVENIIAENTTLKCTYQGNLHQHGWINESGGSWAFEGGEGDRLGFTVPCYEISVRFYNSKKNRIVQLGYDVKKITKGWPEKLNC